MRRERSRWLHSMHGMPECVHVLCVCRAWLSCVQWSGRLQGRRSEAPHASELRRQAREIVPLYRVSVSSASYVTTVFES